MDRRRAERFEVMGLEGELVAYRLKELHDRVLDLSLTGAFVETTNAPPVGSPVALLLRPEPGAEGVALRGRVVNVVRPSERAHAPGVGVAFETPPVHIARQLAGLIETLEGAVDDDTPIAMPVVQKAPLPTPDNMARVISKLLLETNRLSRRVRSLEQENAVLRAMALPPPPVGNVSARYEPPDFEIIDANAAA
jgi:Tfp pilus assembly protein PilZ